MGNKKYLDLEGLKFLWSKISMEDYPNNETLIAVLNAIDETKADKDKIPTKVSQLENDSNYITEEQVQADWTQNDETAKDFIKNKPFYDALQIAEDATPIFGPIEITQQQTSTPGFYVSNYPGSASLVSIIDGQVAPLEFSEERGYYNNFYLSNDFVEFLEVANSYQTVEQHVTIHNYTKPVTLTVYRFEDVTSEFKQLDEKFIPDTIARVKDIPEIEVATDEEVITMLMELDMLHTLVDSEGALLIDNNGSIPI